MNYTLLNKQTVALVGLEFADTALALREEGLIEASDAYLDVAYSILDAVETMNETVEALKDAKEAKRAENPY